MAGRAELSQEQPREWEIFVSYARADKNVVLALVDLFRSVSNQWHRANWIFIDQRNIEPGAPWPDVLERAVIGSKRVLLFWSASAAQSEGVKKEIDIALAQRIPILPVRLDDAPLEERLKNIQYVTIPPMEKSSPAGSRHFSYPGIYEELVTVFIRRIGEFLAPSDVEA